MVFTIRKGKHRSWWIPILTARRKIEGTFKFLGDVSYKDSIDTNKLFGLSDSFYHRKSSIRLGWRFKRGLELMVIIHNKFETVISSLGYIESDKQYPFKIEIRDDEYYVEVDGRVYTHSRNSKWWFLRYYLFPYFGGKQKAPKTFKIKIKW